MTPMPKELEAVMNAECKKWSLGWNPTLSAEKQQSGVIAMNFKGGFTACFEHMSKENERLRGLLREARVHVDSEWIHKDLPARIDQALESEGE